MSSSSLISRFHAGFVLKVLTGTRDSGAGGWRRADAGADKPVLNQQLRDERARSERLSNIPHFLPALNFILHDIQLK